MKRRILFATLVATVAVWAQKPQYIGAGGCSGSNCHGGTSPAEEKISRILTTEYSVWSIADKHSRAAKVLEEPRSKKMAEILGIANPLSDAKCASCHVVGSPERAKSDGVACEACHGAAEKWLGPHTQQNSHATSLSLGMVDTKNLRVRAQTCLGCHLGGEGRNVDHELIAAGHPDLAFEMETFSFAQPAHYRDPKPAAGNSLPKVRMMAVGQAMALGEAMRLLEKHAMTRWPEFSDLDCYQCHHDLRAESWRIERGYAGRRPGSAQLNLARTDVLRTLVAGAAEGQRAEFEAALNRLAAAVSASLGNWNAIASAAKAVAAQADGLAARWETTDFTAGMARGMAQGLVRDIGRIAASGPHSAEQATMGLDALSASYAGNPQAAAKAMGELYNYLEHPSTYQAREFAAMFRRVAGMVQ
ncbi:MAG: hypothetical protein JNK48_12550 [Bryobacterales bacterium]|nr:hypothetical protein [Bryobacterales bacterium]